MIDFSTPLAGMNAATESLNRVAANIASSGSNTAGDTVNLSADAVAMIEAKNDFATNVKAAQIEDQLTQSLLKIVG